MTEFQTHKDAVSHLLREKSREIVEHATASISRSGLSGYERDGEEVVRERLAKLLELTITAIEKRHLDEITRYAHSMSEARFAAGFEFSEVQTAINVLEEAIWKNVLTSVPPAELPEALGLVATVLGVAKDVTARTWVALASQIKMRSLNLEALFQGTSGF
ncbi:MAG: hypothetical protein IT186_20890 [Acidobacteria bacterium]|nr:hypothetical protein [Acidobacteriota bacterium]MCG3193561.1 hypothetical protein [Thermoanaerobaculia bacterium]MCK6685662.1 hypothetical protein [Thermoanaerobaculia bacterium]